MAYLDGLDKHDRLDKGYELAELIEVRSISSTAYLDGLDKFVVFIETNQPTLNKPPNLSGFSEL